MPRLPWLCDRLLLPYRLARARTRQSFITASDTDAPPIAEVFRCDFPEGEVAYNGIGAGHDGTIYFAVSTRSLTPGRLFAFDPGARSLELVADLGSAFPSSDRTIPHGKIHVDLGAVGDRLYGATHVGFYESGAATERPGGADGHAPYPGGWFFAIADRRVLPCARAPAGEGVIAMGVDAGRHRAYGLTWPRGRLLSVDLAAGDLIDHGPVMGAGESGSAGDWRRICRSVAVHPPTGRVYWSDDRGAIWRLDGDRVDEVARIPIPDIWRKVCWHPERRVFYGWTWREALLFRFDPESLTCHALPPLPPVGTGPRRPGTLALSLDAAGGRLHLLTRGPGLLRPGRIQLAGTVNHVVYDLDSGVATVRGPLVTGDGCGVTQAQSLLLAGGHGYAVAWIEVPAADRSSYARAVRARRRNGMDYRTRGYAEAIALIRFPIGGGA